MGGYRRFWTLAAGALLVLARAASAQYDPPAGYYATATGTGATLKNQLRLIISTGDTPVSYDTARSALQVTDDATPANPNDDLIVLVYDRVVLDVSDFDGPPAGWDQGDSWDREHTWPQSRGLSGTSTPDGSDLHALRPSTPSVNNSRSNSNFGGAYGSTATNGLPYGYVNDNGATLWYPGNADAGMIARHSFYMAVRYDGSESGTTNLELGNNDPPNNGSSMGNLNRLVEWHYAAVPDSFELRRNHIIYTDYQNNRNPFIDRPELAWSVFVDQANDSRITIDGTTPDANGVTTRNVNLGRVFTGSATPSAQSFTLSKSGLDGTYFEVSTAGAATSSITGRFNAFRTNQIDSKSISVGLNTNTTTSGLRSGTVTVNNLDVTTGGGAGRGANDGNDVFNVNLTVLDHATPSFSNAANVFSHIIDFGTRSTASAPANMSFDVFNRGTNPTFTANMDFDSVLSSGATSVLTTTASALAGSLVLAGGAGQTFAATMSTAAVGAFTATYTLKFSDENIAGAQNKDLMLTLVGNVVLAGDYNRDGAVDTADYLVWRKTSGNNSAAFEGADGDGSGFIDTADLAVLQMHFGQVASGTGGSNSVPEPGTIVLALATAAFAHALRRRRPAT